MKYRTHIKEGLLNLYYAKLRTILALLGVMVGTASVVAMVLGGELATEEALKQFKSLGTDLLSLSINQAGEQMIESGGKVDHLTLSQVFSILNAHSSIVNIAPYTQLYYPIVYQGQALNGMILGVTDHFADMIQLKLKSGRFVSLLDQYEFYCVIGHDIYDAMKKMSYKEPLGQRLQVGKNVFVIVGVADPWPENSFVYANINTSILIPILTSSIVSKYANMNNMILRLTPDANINDVENKIEQYIDSFASGKRVDFRSAKELIITMKKQSDILTIFLGLIGGISLIVGGIRVMNMMLVSVMERKREIGIRMAVGAKRMDIGYLFLIESVMLTGVGGALGVIVGVLIAYIISFIWHWDFAFFLWPPIVGFTVSLVVGVFFGFYPAYLASKLNPIDALRSEV